jgi:hypothetical protein
MDKKQKVVSLMVCIVAIYVIALATGLAFVVFLFKGEFIRAGIVLLIELGIFFIGKTLRRQLWQQ